MGTSGGEFGEQQRNKVLTVSIAAYNVEEYLAEAIESCLIDDIKLLDIIVVDDGSRDGSADVARSFEERWPDSIRVVSKENGGYGSTLNTSLSLARGKYFRYLDGDDWFDKDGLTAFVDCLKEIDDDVVLTPYQKRFVVTSTSEIVDPVYTTPEGSHRFSDLEILRGMTCSITYRTQVLRDSDAKFSERIFYTDNEYALLGMRLVETAYVLHIPFYQYRIGREGQSVTIDSVVSHRRDEHDILFRLLATYAPHGTIDEKFEARAFVLSSLSKISHSAYRDLILAPFSPEIYKELKRYDREFSAYPEVYQRAGQDSNLVRFIRATRLIGYPAAHIFLRYKYRSGVVV